MQINSNKYQHIPKQKTPTVNYVRFTTTDNYHLPVNLCSATVSALSLAGMHVDRPRKKGSIIIHFINILLWKELDRRLIWV
jgi:hypothetical protein